MLYATTPLGHRITITPRLAGTSNHGGIVMMGGIVLSSWWEIGTGLRTLEDAIAEADQRIIDNMLSDRAPEGRGGMERG